MYSRNIFMAVVALRSAFITTRHVDDDGEEEDQLRHTPNMIYIHRERQRMGK